MNIVLPSRSYAVAALVFILLSGVAESALITAEENFNSTPVSTIPTGWQVHGSGTTTAAVGVNGTNAFVTSNTQGGGLQTATTFDLTTGTTYDFNASFYFTGTGTSQGQGLFGIGFTSGTASTPNNSGGSNRMMVAVAVATTGNYSLATGGQFDTMNAARRIGSTFTLATSVWYSLSGSVNYIDGTSTFNFTNLSLVNIGATGTSAPGPNLFGTTSVSTAVSTGNGSALIDTAARFGVFDSGHGSGRGTTTFDNINVVPEPSTWILIALGLTFLMVMRGRKRAE
jgi:hypothetical protein